MPSWKDGADLGTELRNFLDSSEPPALRPLVVKLASVGKRLAAVNGGAFCFGDWKVLTRCRIIASDSAENQ